MNKDFYISLIARKLSNELNASQLKDLSSWLMSSKDNAVLMDDFKSVWQLTGQYKKGVQLDVDQSFNAFRQKFDIPKAEPSVLEAFARKKVQFSLRYPIIILIGLCLAALLYFSGMFSTASVSNENMHAMTVQLDSHSSLTLAPRSVYKPGKAQRLDGGQKEKYISLFNIIENKKASSTVQTSGLYEPVSTLFEPSVKNFIIEDFEGQGFFELKSINEDQAFLGLGNGVALGTRDAAFNIQNYKDENHIIIDVKSGTLTFYDGRNNAYLIHSGAHAEYSKDSGRLTGGQQSGMNPFKWHKGILVFDNTPLDEVFSMIEKYYGVDINITDGSSTEGISFTATMSMSNNLNDCLDLLHESVDMKIRRIGLRQIEVSHIRS